jgi:hypothetical protein
MGSIMQNLSTPQGGAISVPSGVLTNMVGGAPRAGIGVYGANPLLLMVRTTIDYAWPDVAATFAPGGGPGIPGTFVVLTGPGGGSVVYHGGTKAFGGPAQFAIAPGPFAGTVKVPPSGGGKLPVASVWAIAVQFPPSVTRALLLGASDPLGVAAPGGPGTVVGTTMFGPVPLAIRQFTAMLGPAGTVPLANSFGLGPSTRTNRVTGTLGFPWTTGFITVTSPGALHFGEIFFQSGADDRVAGIGNVAMVSGAVSLRKLSGANANRGWVSLTLPEPAPATGALTALCALALCHALTRRRAR